MFAKKHAIIILLCAAACVLKTAIALAPSAPWWDPAIYIGMGKYLFSGGTIGMWEILRPPLWPVVLGFVWKLGLDPLLVAKLLVAAAGVVTIFLTYLIGEKVKSGLGLIAAFLIALSPAHNFFVSVPTNDIISALAALIAAYFVLEKRFYCSGFVTALAFLLRFPNGFFILPFMLFIFITERSMRKVSFYMLGFFSLAFPYLILNKIIWGDALLPLRLGKDIIENVDKQDWLHYIKAVPLDSPLFLFALTTLVFVVIQYTRTKTVPHAVITLSLLSAAFMGVYLNTVPHKEIRYAFSYYPYLALLAAYGMSVLSERTKLQKMPHVLVGTVFIVSLILLVVQKEKLVVWKISEARTEFYNSVPDNATVVATSPVFMIYTNSLFLNAFESWDTADVQVSRYPTAEYVAYDTCQIFCPTGDCTNKERAFASRLEKAGYSLVFNKPENKCMLNVFKKKDSEQN